jgi:hypothetical protein
MRLLIASALLVVAALTGCGGGKPALAVPDPSAAVGLPPPPVAGPVNTYSGAQSPGAWTLTLDNTNGIFSYQPVTYPASATTGSIQVVNGFTTLGTTGGYALEVEGRAAVLRPGSVTTPLVFAVPQTECYPIAGRIRLPYIGMFAGSGNALLSHGSVIASTDSSGDSWPFIELQGTAVSGPASFTGTCSSTSGQAAINFTSQDVLYDAWAPFDSTVAVPTANTKSSIWVGPSGFFVADQSDPTTTRPTGSSVAGVIEPAAALNTTDMASKKYLGFLYEPGGLRNAGGVTNTYPTVASPVAFGQVTSSGTTMTGGIFPNDDTTQTPNSDITITLGTQDATYNGLYSSVSITVLDPAQNCANYGSGTSGINAQGYITCTFSGLAVVGNPESKYALFITSYNGAANPGGAPMQIYLFQQ